MNKSQFNIKISKDLLVRVKRQATMSGKSLTEHVTDLITTSLSKDEVYLQGNNSFSIKTITNLEKRLMDIESKVSNREYISKRLKPFSNQDAINCTRFMRSVFNKEIEKRDFVDNNEAFDDLLKFVKVYEEKELSISFVDRLKNIMLTDNSSPLTGEELNQITGSDKCKCAIRKGLIAWAELRNCPSQQEICEKGEDLLPLS